MASEQTAYTVRLYLALSRVSSLCHLTIKGLWNKDFSLKHQFYKCLALIFQSFKQNIYPPEKQHVAHELSYSIY